MTRDDEIHELNKRMKKLELWHACLKGAWAALAAAWAWMFREACSR